MVQSSFLTVGSMERTQKCDHSLEFKAVDQYCAVVLFAFQHYLICYFRKLSTVDLALSGVKGLRELLVGIVVTDLFIV